MSKENNKEVTPYVAGDEKPFKGFTMEELKYQRALIALKKDFSKMQLLESVEALRPKRNSTEKSSVFGPKMAFAGQIASKFFKNLNVLDYVMLGMSLFGTAKKAYSLIRRKK